MASPITARLLMPGEPLPPVTLTGGYETLKIDPEWCWVALYEKRFVGLLLGSPCHGVCFFCRMALEKDAPRSTALVLLRQVLRDLRHRKMKGYLTFFNLENDDEYRLARLAARAGAKHYPINGVWAAGTTEVYR